MSVPLRKGIDREMYRNSNLVFACLCSVVFKSSRRRHGRPIPCRQDNADLRVRLAVVRTQHRHIDAI